MKLDRIVTSLEISWKLREAGFVEKSIFSYYENKLGEIFVGETDLTNFEDKFITYCYTFSELLNFLPSELEINPNVYVPNDKTYEKVKLENYEFDKYHFAQLDFFKTQVGEGNDNYVMRYSYGGKMIAFRQNSKGLFCNLLQWGNTESDCCANMLMQLIEEDKLNYNLV